MFSRVLAPLFDYFEARINPYPTAVWKRRPRG